MSDPDFNWQLCDPDKPPGESFRQGHGFQELVDALTDLTANEAEHTPEGFIPSGNVALYWSRSKRIVSEPAP
jgi:hypothetical protein